MYICAYLTNKRYAFSRKTIPYTIYIRNSTKVFFFGQIRKKLGAIQVLLKIRQKAVHQQSLLKNLLFNYVDV